MPSPSTEQHLSFIEQLQLNRHRHPKLLKTNRRQAKPPPPCRASSSRTYPPLDSDIMANYEEKSEGLTKEEFRRINETLSNQAIIDQLSRTGIAAQNKRAMYHGRFKRLEIEEMEKKMKNFGLNNNGSANVDRKEASGSGNANADNEDDKGDGVGNVGDENGSGEEAKDNTPNGSDAAHNSKVEDGENQA